MQEVIESTVKQAPAEGQREVRESKKIKSIDFNCDLAQSFGVYQNESEFSLLDYVSSVNVSTGFHAGDPINIRKALLAAKEKNVVIGAHIGFDDIQGFGCRQMNLSEDEIEALVIYQVGALMSFAKANGLEVEHVRPHGAMYKMASEDYNFSLSIAKAIKKCSKWLVYYGASGETLQKVSDEVKLSVAHEIQLDRVYNVDGSIDFTKERFVNHHVSTKRLQALLRNSQMEVSAHNYRPFKVDTIHFSSRVNNTTDLIKRAYDMIKPVPVNYNMVKESGWV